jgi:hypothetical protein
MLETIRKQEGHKRRFGRPERWWVSAKKVSAVVLILALIKAVVELATAIASLFA